MFSSGMSKGWIQVATKITETNYTQTALTPGATHIFIVRAENFHGISSPSPMSEPIVTGQVRTSIKLYIIFQPLSFCINN